MIERSADGSVMAVEMDTKRGFRPRSARRLFRVPGVLPDWGVTQEERVQQLFRQPVTEIFIVLVRTHADKRQHGDGLFGQVALQVRLLIRRALAGL